MDQIVKNAELVRLTAIQNFVLLRTTTLKACVGFTYLSTVSALQLQLSGSGLAFCHSDPSKRKMANGKTPELHHSFVEAFQETYTMTTDTLEYAGFWVRVGAALIDTVLIVCVTFPLLIAIYGWAYFDGSQTGFVAGIADFLLSWVAPAVAAIAFWLYKQATPGKMAVSARVVDAKTGNTMTVGQSIVRYLGYFVSTIPFGLGLIWVAFDAKKQGWHDKLAGTVVVRYRNRGPEPVKFE